MNKQTPTTNINVSFFLSLSFIITYLNIKVKRIQGRLEYNILKSFKDVAILVICLKNTRDICAVLGNMITPPSSEYSVLEKHSLKQVINSFHKLKIMCVDVPCKHLCALYLKVAIAQNQINLFQGASRKS